MNIQPNIQPNIQYQVAQISIKLQSLAGPYPDLNNLAVIIPHIQNFINIDDAFIILEMEAINAAVDIMETNQQHIMFDELLDIAFEIKNLMNNNLNINLCPCPTLASYGPARASLRQT